MRKATLSKNPIYKNKYRLYVQGLGEVITRVTGLGSLENEIGVVERADKTKTPGGRTGGGSTDIKGELADTELFNILYGWYEQAIDGGGRRTINSVEASDLSGSILGIDPDYKKNATVKLHRLYKSSVANEQPATIRLDGCWLSNISLDELDIDSEEEQMVTMTMQYDDMRISFN